MELGTQMVADNGVEMGLGELMESDGDPLVLSITLEGLAAAVFRQAARALATDHETVAAYFLGLGADLWMKGRTTERVSRQSQPERQPMLGLYDREEAV
jgi:hypothetical protein